MDGLEEVPLCELGTATGVWKGVHELVILILAAEMAELKEVTLRELAAMTRYWRRARELITCSMLGEIAHLRKIKELIVRLVEMALCDCA